jgi:hypothetical protein
MLQYLFSRTTDITDVLQHCSPNFSTLIGRKIYNMTKQDSSSSIVPEELVMNSDGKNSDIRSLNTIEIHPKKHIYTLLDILLYFHNNGLYIQ